MVVLHIMNSSSTLGNNKGYIFANLFDICLYSILSVVFPLLSFAIQFFEAPVLGLQTIYDLLFSEFFVVATFFYDFYSRYRDCEDQTKNVVYILYYGRLLFFVASILIFVLMFLVSKNLFIQDIEKALFVIALLCFYPFIVSIWEARKRMKIERNRKISSRR